MDSISIIFKLPFPIGHDPLNVLSPVQIRPWQITFTAEEAAKDWKQESSFPEEWCDSRSSPEWDIVGVPGYGSGHLGAM